MKNLFLSLVLTMLANASFVGNAHAFTDENEADSAEFGVSAKDAYTCEFGGVEVDIGRGRMKTIYTYKLYKNKEPVRYAGLGQKTFPTEKQCLDEIQKMLTEETQERAN